LAQTSHRLDPRIFQELFGDSKQPALAIAADGLWILDTNDTALELFGYPRRRMLSMRLTDCAQAKNPAALRRVAAQLADDSLTLVKFKAKRRQGRTFVFEGVASPLRYDGQRAVLVLGGQAQSTQAKPVVRTRPAALRVSETLLQHERVKDAYTEFVRTALEEPDQNELLRAAARMLRKTVAIDFVLVYELLERDGKLVCRTAEGWHGDISSINYDPAGTTVAARSLRARIPVAWDYESSGTPEESAAFFARHGVVTAIGIPIQHNRVAYGSIVGYSRTPRRFEINEIRYVQNVADVVALAMDRARSTASLAATNNRISQILDSIVEHFVNVDRDWHITFVNVTVESLFSRPPEALIGEPVAQWFPSFTQPQYRRHYEAAMHEGISSTFEIHSTLNGRYYEARVRPTAEGIGVYFLDITERRVAEEERLRHERRVQRLLDQMPAIMWMTDNDLTLMTSVGGGLRNLNLKDDELVGQRLTELFPDPDAPTRVAHRKALAGEPAGYTDTFGNRSFESHVEPLRGDDDEVIGVAGLTVDITDRVQAEQRLSEAQAIAHFGTWSYDGIADTRSYSAELLRIFGKTAEEMPPDFDFSNLTGLAPDEDARKLSEAVAIAVAHNRPWSVDHRIIDADGSTRHVQNVGQLFVNKNGTVLRGFGSILDITERKLAENELERLANFDTLTGLPNRAYAAVRIALAIGFAKEHHRHVLVCCLDIDGFKAINQTLGHAAGDDLLRSVGGRLSECQRRGDVVSRAGSDEFVLVFADVASPTDVDLVYQKVRRAFDSPFDVLGREMFVNASCGISIYPRDGTDADSLIRAADTALLNAKEAGGGQAVAFVPAMHAGAGARLELNNNLYRAIEREEFSIHYQPIVEAMTRRLTGFEALIRWQHPKLGLVPPDQFIPVAEQTGLIVPIGAWVLKKACRFAKGWNGGAEHYRVSVNLSARQFADAALGASVTRALDESRLDPADLELEVTEGTVVRDIRAGAATLRALGATGVHIAIDDFGVGYSSLSYLRSFTFNTMKIDRTFVRELPASAEDVAVVRGIIGLGHALGLRVTAEGVENERQAEFLTREGCDLLQGFYISKPVPEESVGALIARLGGRA
jgi:diguanylate cyclase (GGDEF)-like protein/PAS domain S-box-containing protein